MEAVADETMKDKLLNKIKSLISSGSTLKWECDLVNAYQYCRVVGLPDDLNIGGFRFVAQDYSAYSHYCEIGESFYIAVTYCQINYRFRLPFWGRLKTDVAITSEIRKDESLITYKSGSDPTSIVVEKRWYFIQLGKFKETDFYKDSYAITKEQYYEVTKLASEYLENKKEEIRKKVIDSL